MIDYEDLTDEDKAELYWSHYYKWYEPEYDPEQELDDLEESEVSDD